MTLPLDDVKVLDVSQALAGPVTGMILGLLGAEVIKIEKPDGGDMVRGTPPYVSQNGMKSNKQSQSDISSILLKRNRNKKSVSLNLKSDRGRELFLGLVEHSDVILENLGPGTMKNLDLGYDTVVEVNPQIVYCSITGFDADSVFSDWVAFDIVLQALSGLMEMTGEANRPPMKAGVLVADYVTALYSSSGILAALRRRDRTNEGDQVRVSMLNCLLNLVFDEPLEYYVENGIGRAGNRGHRAAPWNTYETKDGYVVMCIASDKQWNGLLTVMDRDDLSNDPRFTSIEQRLSNVEELDRIINDWSRTGNKMELAKALQSESVPAAPVMAPSEILDQKDLYASALQTLPHPDFGEINETMLARYPVTFKSGELKEKGRPAPHLGDDTYTVLNQFLQIDSEQYQTLRDDGIV